MFRSKREARCGIFKTKLKKTNSICINPLIFVSVEGFKVLFISAGALNNFVFFVEELVLFLSLISDLFLFCNNFSI